MAKRRNRFEAEIHLGLLVIILLLLSLNFLSNVIIYRTREAKWIASTAQFQNAVIEISRLVGDDVVPQLSEQKQKELRQKYKLSSIRLVPTKPASTDKQKRRQWFSSIARLLPAGQIPELAEKLLTSEYQTLTRGKNDEYFYVEPVGAGEGRNLLIISRNIPDLAYLEDSQRLVIIIGLLAVIATVGIYLLLYRYILAPFREMKKQASRAGRQVDNSQQSDVEIVVEEYTRIIEELKEKERQLRELNAQVQSRADSLELFNQYLLESIHSGIITTDKTGTIKTINRAAGTILEISDDSTGFIGQHYSTLLTDKTAISQWLSESLRGECNIGYQETSYVTPSGQTKKLGVSISVIVDSENNFVGASLLVNDLTETERLRTELETKNRLAALGEMAGGLAHQLRNSMGAISGYGRLLKKRLARKGIQEPSFDSMIEETIAAEELTDRFLQFARPLAVETITVSIKEEVAEFLESCRTQEKYTGIEFVEQYAADAEVSLDPLLFRQVLGNLVDNAVNAYPDRQGKIEIHIEADMSEVKIHVRDFGCGIAEINRDNIFTPFFSSRPSGTGLGLPLANKIVDLHGGNLSLTSTSEQGTTFTISLPVVTKPANCEVVVR